MFLGKNSHRDQPILGQVTQVGDKSWGDGSKNKTLVNFVNFFWQQYQYFFWGSMGAKWYCSLTNLEIPHGFLGSVGTMQLDVIGLRNSQLRPSWEAKNGFHHSFDMFLYTKTLRTFFVALFLPSPILAPPHPTQRVFPGRLLLIRIWQEVVSIVQQNTNLITSVDGWKVTNGSRLI